MTAVAVAEVTRDSGQESVKRRQILDGARRVFLADGFDGASMNDIARVAGVSKGTLYVYFDSKEALFEALIREDRKQQAERLVIPDGAADPREPLAAFGRALIALMTQPELIAQVRIVIAATGKFPNLGRAFYESGPCYGETRLAERLEAWRADGWLDFADGRLAARQFIDLCKSGVFSACLFGIMETATPEAIADTVDAAVVVFMRAYGTRLTAKF
jgi:AcrR family transcriptional regulator